MNSAMVSHELPFNDALEDAVAELTATAFSRATRTPTYRACVVASRETSGELSFYVEPDEVVLHLATAQGKTFIRPVVFSSDVYTGMSIAQMQRRIRKACQSLSIHTPK